MSELLTFPDRHAFRAWLASHGAKSGGVWLVFGKKGGPKTLTANEALEEALCFGWIDGRMESLDAASYKKYFARRTPKSNWSEKNKKLAEALLEQGIVAQPGRDAIAEAKKRSEWDKPKRPVIDKEKIAAFVSLVRPHGKAHQNLGSMPPSVQKTYAGFYYDAKQEKTRLTRLKTIVDRLEKNLKPM